MAAYVIQHSLVGVHRQGDVVEFDKDTDTDRLLRLEAIRKADKDESDRAVQYGDTDEELARVFPAVPFQNTPENATTTATLPVATETEGSKKATAAAKS